MARSGAAGLRGPAEGWFQIATTGEMWQVPYNACKALTHIVLHATDGVTSTSFYIWSLLGQKLLAPPWPRWSHNFRKPLISPSRHWRFLFFAL